VLDILYLIQADLLILPILCLSRHIIAHKVGYYRLLQDATRIGNLVEKDIAQR
jgi:Fic family protein